MVDNKHITKEDLFENQSEIVDAINKLRKQVHKLKITVAALKIVAKIDSKKEYKHIRRLMKNDIDETHKNSDDEDEPLEEQHDERSITNNIEDGDENETESVEEWGGNIKPYKCKACGRGFAYPQTLKYHLKHNCKRIVKGNGFISGNGLVQH